MTARLALAPLVLALAAAPAPAQAAEAPLTVDHALWREVDRRASGTAALGGWMTVVGPLSMGAGLVVQLAADDVGADGMFLTGEAMLITGGFVGGFGPFFMGAGSLRAARSLKERGVDVSITGATTALFAPFAGGFIGGVLLIAQVPIGTMFIVAGAATSIIAGYSQLELNRRARLGAGEPPIRLLRSHPRLLVLPTRHKGLRADLSITF